MEHSELILYTLLCLIIGYLLGSFSPSYLIGRLKGYDVRERGTGNAGASNTVIMAGNLAGAVVAILDITKSTLAFAICSALFPFSLAGFFGGIAAIFGHMFPIYLNFRGGKGLACIGGVILACEPRAFLPLLALAMLICFLTHSPSLVAPIISVVWPIYYGLKSGAWTAAAVLAIPIVPILIKHVPNYRRIAAGEEPRMRFLWNKEDELQRIQKEKQSEVEDLHI